MSIVNAEKELAALKAKIANAENEAVKNPTDEQKRLAEFLHSKQCKLSHADGWCGWDWDAHFLKVDKKPIDWTKGSRRTYLLKAVKAVELGFTEKSLKQTLENLKEIGF